MSLASTSESSANRLAVLIATYNGAVHLEEQMQSIADQSWAKIDVWASDDGSTDATDSILGRWAAKWSKGRFRVERGPSQGYANNFRSLLVNRSVDADYVAFCDQDDIWLPDKTREAVAALPSDPTVPGLYCARTIVVDAAGAQISRSPRFTRPPDFRNALVQNIGGGNTMVMNRAGFELVREAATLTDFVSHDWFAYLVISGAGGRVVYSEVPHVLYRQHGNNAIGTNQTARARWERLIQLFHGRFMRWNAHNLRGLEACRELLRPQALEVMRQFEGARKGPLARRLQSLRRSGVYRQETGGQAFLYIACVLGKL